MEKNCRKKGKLLKNQTGGATSGTELSIKQQAIDRLRDRFRVRLRDGVGGLHSG